MKQLTCEMCGSTELMKQDGVFVCQTCGCKYSVEEAKKMMVEGTVDVSGSTVKVDSSDELNNLYQLARRAREATDFDAAEKYYEQIVIKDPSNWEASFYSVYFSVTNTDDVGSVLAVLKSNVDTVFNLIKESVTDIDEQKKALSEVVEKLIFLYEVCVDSTIETHQTDDLARTIYCGYECGDKVIEFFGESLGASIAVNCWKQIIALHHKSLIVLGGKYDLNMTEYENKVKKYEPSYQRVPQTNNNSGGCYVATAVYGSYDCPEVWTLRRYRDNQLAKTWYGRLFIHTYYAISPTIVKWFGDTEWFKKMWKGKLDHMVKNLQLEGVESTPYEDRNW